MHFKDKSIWSYLSLPLVSKLQAKIAVTKRTAERSGHEDPMNAIKNLIVAIMSDCDFTPADIEETYNKYFAKVESVEQTEEAEAAVTVNTVDLGDEDEEEEIIFEDEGEALESVGLPIDEEELAAMKKSNIIASLYSSADVVSFLGLPEAQADCEKAYTKTKLIEFIFNEEGAE